MTGLPSFCRVAATSKPAVKFEVWLPLSNWNEKFQGVGNGAKKKVGKTMDAFDPNLSRFIARGGKLLMYHGWNDPSISPFNTINYYESVVATLNKGRDAQAAAAKTQESVRLFMAPGMLHCGGGPGPNNFDMLTALEQWVENKQAPERIVASHSTNGAVDRTRPLCVYPKVAVYTGSGSTDDAANFVCK